MEERIQMGSAIFAYFFLVLLVACLASWGGIIGRLARKEQLLPLAARRRVPWIGADVLLILFVYVLTTGAVMRGLRLFVSVPQNEAAVPFGAAPDNAHPALRVLGLGITSGADWVVALTALSVVVVAPVFEEFFFRVVIQGWFESVDAR